MAAEISFRDTFTSPEGRRTAWSPDAKGLWEIAAHESRGQLATWMESRDQRIWQLRCAPGPQASCEAGHWRKQQHKTAGLPSRLMAEVSLAGCHNPGNLYPGNLYPPQPGGICQVLLTRGLSRAAAFSSQPHILSLAFGGRVYRGDHFSCSPLPYTSSWE